MVKKLSRLLNNLNGNRFDTVSERPSKRVAATDISIVETTN